MLPSMARPEISTRWISTVARPPEQRMLEKVGEIARYGRAADGSEALIVQGHDTPPRIVVRGPDGRVRVEIEEGGPSCLRVNRSGRYLPFSQCVALCGLARRA